MSGFFGAGGMGGNVERHIGDDDRDGAAIEALQPGGNGMTHAARDVLAERQRQIEVEGWTPEHDDAHSLGQMAGAALCYLAEDIPHWARQQAHGCYWPWDAEWWKPGDHRRNLVKAGALILAEIERLDRATRPASAHDAIPAVTDKENMMTTLFEGAPKFSGISIVHTRVTTIKDRVVIRAIDEMAEETVTIAMTPDQARALAAGIVAAAENAEAHQ